MRFVHTISLALLASVVMVGALSGCATTDPDRGDAGPKQRDECTARVQLCKNKCAKADLGVGCTLCCDRNGLSCDLGGDFSFSLSARLRLAP